MKGNQPEILQDVVDLFRGDMFALSLRGHECITQGLEPSQLGDTSALSTSR